MRAYTLVITDGSYMEVHLFRGVVPPCLEQIYYAIDFAESEELSRILKQLIETVKKDYAALTYDDNGKKYLFHLKVHNLLEKSDEG